MTRSFDRNYRLKLGLGTPSYRQGFFMRLGPRPTVRRTVKFCLAVVALMPLGHAHAQPTDD
jgi:hypothetical protein